MIRYFAVETKCGHVGKDKCIYIWFAVKAENGKAAAARAREYKRVKHHHKDAIRMVREVSFEEYFRLKIENEQDPYLHCKNIQEQRELSNLEDRVEVDEYILAKHNKPARNRDTEYILKKIAIQAKDTKRQLVEEYDDDIAV